MQSIRLNGVMERIPSQPANEKTSRLKTEEILVQRSVNGEIDAFVDLQKAYLSRIYRYVLYLVKDPAIAEKLTEETFLKAWQSLNSYHQEEQSFLSWLYRIAHDRVLAEYRTKKYFRIVGLEDIPPVGLEGEIANSQGIDPVWTPKNVINFLQYLPFQQRQLIILRFMEGLESKDIEEITGMKPGAILNQQLRAISTLQSKIHEEE